MNTNQTIEWLLESDPSIQYQVWRDLLGIDKTDLQNRIATEGWGLRILSEQHPNGHWGDHFYQPKWISTHYTLLDLRNLNLSSSTMAVQDTIQLVLRTQKSDDGGIRLGPGTAAHSDVCLNGMFLNYASYCRMPEIDLQSIVDSILAESMPDGGFNCRTTRSGVIASPKVATV